MAKPKIKTRSVSPLTTPTADGSKHRWFAFVQAHPVLFGTLMIFVLGFLIYSNTYNVSPRFDDSIFIFDRINVRDISRIWVEGDLYRKIPYLTFALNYQWTQDRVWSWHLVNLLLHLAATFTVYGIARAAWRSRRLDGHPMRQHAAAIAFFSALLFLCHPVQTSAVTYIYQRMIVIATLFHMLTLYGYLRARVDGRREYWVLFAGAGILACFTKQVNLSLPATVLLTEMIFCSESAAVFIKRGIRFLPLAAVPAGLYAWMMKIDFSRLSLDTLKRLYPLNVNSSMTWGEWIPTQINVMRTYLRLLIFPMNQTLDYDYPVAASFTEPSVMISLAVIGVVLAAGAGCYRRHPMICWGIFFMAFTLSIEFFAIRDIIFEHRLYLPIVGFVIAAPPALYAIIGDAKKSRAFAIMALVALSTATFARNAIWANEEHFWKEGIRLAPNKGRPYYSLGVYYALRGEHAKAVPLYQKAVEIWPGFADAYSNLGKSIEETGHMDQAIFYYAKALELDPTLPEALNNYGSALTRVGRYDEARKAYAEAIARKPDNYEAMSNMGSTYARQGNLVEAEKWYRRSMAANPLHSEANSNLGSILGLRGDYAGAEKLYLEATRLKPDNFEAHNNLAVIYTQQERYDEAIREYAEACRIRPNFWEGLNSLGSLLARKQQYAEAERYYLKTIAVNPAFVDVKKNLANVYKRTGHPDREKALLLEVIRLKPNDTAALERLNQLEGGTV